MESIESFMRDEAGNISNTVTRKVIYIPDEVAEDKEVEAVYLINKVLKNLDHTTQHRVLDFFKDKFSVSKSSIAKLEELHR